MLSNLFRSLFGMRAKPQVGDIWYYIADAGWKSEHRCRVQVLEINGMNGHIKYRYLNDNGELSGGVLTRYNNTFGDGWELESPADLNG